MAEPAHPRAWAREADRSLKRSRERRAAARERDETRLLSPGMRAAIAWVFTALVVTASVVVIVIAVLGIARGV